MKIVLPEVTLAFAQNHGMLDFGHLHSNNHNGPT